MMFEDAFKIEGKPKSEVEPKIKMPPKMKNVNE